MLSKDYIESAFPGLTGDGQVLPEALGVSPLSRTGRRIEQIVDAALDAKESLSHLKSLISQHSSESLNTGYVEKALIRELNKIAKSLN